MASVGGYYFLRRFYSPSLQRFFNRDPMQEFGGINLYGYVANSPIYRIDPLGLCPPGNSNSLPNFVIASIGNNIINSIAAVIAAINIYLQDNGVSPEDLLDQPDTTQQQVSDYQENEENAPSDEQDFYKPVGSPPVNTPETPLTAAVPTLASELLGPVTEASAGTIVAGATVAVGVGAVIGYGVSQLPVYGGGNVSDFYGGVFYGWCPTCF